MESRTLYDRVEMDEIAKDGGADNYARRYDAASNIRAREIAAPTGTRMIDCTHAAWSGLV
jgi:hypothetical protein